MILQIIRITKRLCLNMLCLFSLSLLTMCSKTQDKKYEIIDNDNASEWLNDFMPVKTGMFMSIEEVPYITIEDEYRDEYVNILNDKQYFILKDEDYFLLTGKILQKQHGIAIRGVYTNLDGSFSVTRNVENEYVVMYIFCCVTFSYNKTVLIIETDNLPVEIYVCFGGGGA